MASQTILIFEYYLLAAQVFAQGFVEEARHRATGASSMGHTDTWHDEVFKLELIQKSIEATISDQLRGRLLSPDVVWPEQIAAGNRVDLGAVVTIQEHNYPSETYLLTGDTSVPEHGLITTNSPLGQGLAGTTKDTTTSVQMPSGLLEVRILHLTYDVSELLVRYLRWMFEEATEKLERIRVAHGFQAFAESARRARNGTGRAGAERDYFELLASIVAHTAKLEAMALIADAYHLPPPLEEECTQELAVYRRLFEEQGMSFASLHTAPYCHPKQS